MLISTTLLLLYFNPTFSKDPFKSAWIYREKIDSIKNTQFYWYGIDVSIMRLVEGKRMDMKERVAHQYCPAWVNLFNEKGTDFRLSWYFENKKIKIESDGFGLQRVDHVNIESLVDYKLREYNYDTIYSNLKTYNLKQTEGLGFVFIVGNLIKDDEKTEGYSVFFDIKTRKPLWICKTYSGAGGKGLTAHWGEGMFKCFGIFISDFYKAKVPVWGKVEKTTE